MTDQLGIFTYHVQPTGDNAVPAEAADRPYDYYTEGPFTCADCGGEILRGEPHQRKSLPKPAVIDSEGDRGSLGEPEVSGASPQENRPQQHRHFCCQPTDCLYGRYLIGERDKSCQCAHVTNVGWWPCSECGVAHGGHCPSPDAPLPPWPPAGWRDAETGRAHIDRRREAQRRRMDFERRPSAVAGQRRAAREQR